MLKILKNKIENTPLEKIINLCKCSEKEINLSKKVDFILIFYMMHEVPNQDDCFAELKDILKPEGKILIVEPKFHVSKDDFNKTRQFAIKHGFKIIAEPKILFSRTIELVINKEYD
jgi:ubiquinone/menaquinone biosynthesis C-methylase UbiE